MKNENGLFDYIDDYWMEEEDLAPECFVPNETSPLKIFASQYLSDISYKMPMDGVLRNIVFTNIATNTILDTTCEA